MTDLDELNAFADYTRARIAALGAYLNWMRADRIASDYALRCDVLSIERRLDRLDPTIGEVA